jgi:hypothetical protein
MSIRTDSAEHAAHDIAAIYRGQEGANLRGVPAEIHLDNGGTLWVSQAKSDDGQSILIGAYVLTEATAAPYPQAVRQWILTPQARLLGPETPKRHR